MAHDAQFSNELKELKIFSSSKDKCREVTRVERSQPKVPHQDVKLKLCRRRSSSLSIIPRPNTLEYSGNSPRSAKSESSSSLNVVKVDDMSISVTSTSVKIGLSSMVVEEHSKSENHPNSLQLISEDSPRLVNFSSELGSDWLAKLLVSFSRSMSETTILVVVIIVVAAASDANVFVFVFALLVHDVVVVVRWLCWLFLEAGQGWLCSQEYVTTNMLGSARLLSTCFLAGHPFELLHL